MNSFPSSFSTATVGVVLPVRQIHSLNSVLCTSIGSVLNLLLVWLVLKKTPKEMRVYSKILLQTCVCDLLLLALSEIVQPIPFVLDGVFLVLENGVAAHFPSPLNVVAFDLWMTCSFASVAGIGVQFIYRYLVLCRSMNLGKRGYFVILCGVMCTQLAFMAFFCWIGIPLPNEMVRDDSVLHLMGEQQQNISAQDWQLRTVFHGDIADPRWFVWLMFCAANNCFIYAVIAFCGVKMVTYVRGNLKMGKQKRIMEINRQMTLNMLVQASLPMLVLSSHSTVLYASLAPRSQQQWLMCVTVLLGPAVNWVPVLNPLVTVFTVAPYRRTVLRLGNNTLPASETKNNQQMAGSNQPMRAEQNGRQHYDNNSNRRLTAVN